LFTKHVFVDNGRQVLRCDRGLFEDNFPASDSKDLEKVRKTYEPKFECTEYEEVTLTSDSQQYMLVYFYVCA